MFEVDEIIRLLVVVFLLHFHFFGLLGMLGGQEPLERAPASLDPDSRVGGSRVGQDVHTHGHPVLGVIVHGVRAVGGVVHLANHEQVGDDQHGFGGRLVELGAAQFRVGAKSQDQFGHAGGQHGGEEKVATKDDGAQVGLGLVVACQRGHIGLARDGRLRGVRSVGEDGRTGSDSRRLRRANLGCQGGTDVVRPVLHERILPFTDERQPAQRRLERLERRENLFRGSAVLGNDPKDASRHPGRADNREGVHHPIKDIPVQLGVGLRDFPQKVGHLQRRYCVGVGQKVHQQVQHRGSDLREADCALVDGTDEHRPVLGPILDVPVLRLHRLLLQHGHHLVDAPGADQVERDRENLFLHVQVGGGQGPQHVHQHLGHDVPMLLLEVVQTIQDDQFDVVVTLLDQQLAEARRRRPDGGRRARQ
mmetsp:Transcript_1765/g.5850  ORF Transcript_1765/g.5850 Transcript_1765/m.5850 type:complete len:420 (+) Transcript_1765:870-2129(+)